MFRLTQTQDNAIVATHQYLKAIGAKVTAETVEDTLKNHPNYPSLLATSDALNEWSIENVALKIKPEQLTEIPTPFLVYLNTNRGKFALVNSVKNDSIEWIDTKEGHKKERIVDFCSQWDGVVLMAETNEQSGEKNYTENRKKEIRTNLRTPILLIGTALIIAYLLYQNFSTNWVYNTLLITKLAGTIVSCLLLWQSIDKNNPFIQTLCQAGGKKSDCNNILNSKAAQLVSWLSWSEVGFFYFAGGFIYLLIPPAPDGGVNVYHILSILALPYIFWSIYHQSFIAKQWCTLCLAIQGILLIEFGLSINALSNIPLFDFSDIVAPLLGTGGAFLTWLFLKPILQKSQQVQPLKNNLRKFKNNPYLFYSLLKSQEEMPFVAHYIEPVKIGNLEAEHTITMVTNPFCQPCARTHKIIEDLLENNENLNCQVIFSASNVEGDKRGTVARSIFSLPKEKQAEALTEWYKNEDRSVEKWQKKFDIIENEKAIEIIQQHSTWCEIAKIEGTPTLYLDGFKMPSLYRLGDLKWILNYLPTTDFAKS